MTTTVPGGLTVTGGVAYYLGALLGGGLLVLPALAYAKAGPASVLTWVALLLMCALVALTFAALGAKFPDSGGISTFAQHAFGDRAAAIGGYWFYFLLPFGAPPAALVGGDYVAASLNAGQGTGDVAAVALLGLALGVNALGINLSAKVQLAVVGVLLTVLVTAVVVAALNADPANAQPLAPKGWAAVPKAGALLFFAFAGWEAVTHLAGEFKDPSRDLRRVAWWTLALVSSLYLGLAITSVLALGPELGELSSPIADMLTLGIGDIGRQITGPVAALLSCATMISFIAGASRLGATLAGRELLPRGLCVLSGPSQVPRRSLAVVAVGSAVVLGIAITFGIGPGPLMEIAAGCAALVTALGMASGARLLEKPGNRRVAGLAALLMAAVALTSAWYLAYALVLALVAIGVARRVRRSRADRAS